MTYFSSGDPSQILCDHFMDAHRRIQPRQLFDPQKDALLRQLVVTHGEKNWKAITEKIPGRTKRQCSERWKHYLSPNVICGAWTAPEDERLFTMVQTLGPRWKRLEGLFPGRTDNHLKNRHKRLMRKAKRSNKVNSQPVTEENMEILAVDVFSSDLDEPDYE
jgi:hypothetical protein